MLLFSSAEMVELLGSLRSRSGRAASARTVFKPFLEFRPPDRAATVEARRVPARYARATGTVTCRAVPCAYRRRSSGNTDLIRVPNQIVSAVLSLNTPEGNGPCLRGSHTRRRTRSKERSRRLRFIAFPVSRSAQSATTRSARTCLRRIAARTTDARARGSCGATGKPRTGQARYALLDHSWSGARLSGFRVDG